MFYHSPTWKYTLVQFLIIIIISVFVVMFENDWEIKEPRKILSPSLNSQNIKGPKQNVVNGGN